MSRKIYHEDVKIIKKPLKSKVKLFFSIILFFLIITGIIVSSFYISKSITVGNVGSLFVYGDTDIKINKKTMYLVVLGKYVDKNEAEKVSLGATVQGASGFIWETEKNEYLVVGSMYENIADAESVKNNLTQSSNYSVIIEEVVMPKVDLNFDEYENKDVSEIKNAIDFFDTVYADIYNYSIKFDKNEINNLAISSEISELRGKAKGYINKIQSLLSIPNAKLQVIQQSMIELDELMDSAVIRTIDNTGLNYYLKNTFVKVARLKYDCLNKLK